MFKTNDSHKQISFFESTNWMNPSIKSKLEKSWAPIFYEHVFCEIDETPFSTLYSTIGKPNTPVNILLCLDYIKHMRTVNDLELIDSFYFDYQVNYALGIRILGEMNLAPRTLYYFRERIYKFSIEHPDKEDLLFGQFIKLCKRFAKESGISFDEQRTDTTLFMSNIKKAGRMSLAHDVLIKVIKAIPEEKLTDGLKKAFEPSFKTDVLYRTRSNDTDSKLVMLLTLCKQALSILEEIPGMEGSEEVRIAKRFLAEQTIPDLHDDKIISKPKTDISSDSLQSAYDEDATFRSKGKVKQSGYVLEISETCNKDNPYQLITDYVVESNNTSDVEIIQDRLPEICDNVGCTDMYVDGGFHSKDVHKLAEEKGVNIHLTNMTGKDPQNRVSIEDFDIDPKTRLINKCPAGHTGYHHKSDKSQTSVHYSHETCKNCPLYDKCYSREQKKDHVVRLTIKAIDTSLIRAEMDKNIIESTSKRAAIEGTNSALKRKGQAKLAVRGKNKVTVVSGLKVNVQNIKRFIKYKQGEYKSKKNTIKIQDIFMPITV